MERPHCTYELIVLVRQQVEQGRPDAEVCGEKARHPVY
jgi:hypothetical protein